jgi:hypothetical protein
LSTQRNQFHYPVSISDSAYSLFKIQRKYLEKFGLIFRKHFPQTFSDFIFQPTFFRQHHLKTDFVFNYFFKKPGTENEIEFTTKVAIEIESWLMWLNVSPLTDYCDSSELRTVC